MMKQIVIFFLVCIFSFGTVFGYSQYRDEATVEKYKTVIENRLGDTIQNKTVKFRIDFLLKIEKLLDAYERKNISEQKKKEAINVLIAFQEFVEQSFEFPVSDESASIQITVIDDMRCNDCYTAAIMQELQGLPYLQGASYVVYDFSDEGIAEYMNKQNIQFLPAVIFNTNDFEDGGSLTPYLQSLPEGGYSLALGASFDPFETRSQRGYKLIDRDVFQDIKDDSYMKGSSTAEITLIEYSDLECPFCAKLHNDMTLEKIQENYGNEVNFVFQHFPLSFHTQALEASEILECVAEQKGSSEFYTLITKFFSLHQSNKFSVDNMNSFVDNLGIDISECMEEQRYQEKIHAQFERGMKTFSITGTPSVIMVNNITGEYDVVSGAYPYASFEEKINNLLR